VAALKQLSQRTEKLLQMSRASGGAALAHKPVDMAHLTVQVLETFWIDPAVPKRLHLSLPSQDDFNLTVQGDEDTLAIALRNLVENALRYAPTGNVWVAINDAGELSVTDDGPGVDAATLQRLQTDNTHTPQDSMGHGLGLSIVKAIAQKHQAALTLLSPSPASPHGFKASLTF
jgi:two-component system, OmpR family, sensor kinase